MNANTRIWVLLGAATLVAAAAIAWQYRQQANLTREAAAWRRENKELQALREESRRIAGPLAAAKADAADAAESGRGPPRREGNLQKRSAPPPGESASEIHDPEKNLTPVEQCRNVGRATPAAAFQTLIWAAIQGQDAELAATLDVSGTAREKAEAWLASLPESARVKYSTPESLPALFLAEEIVRKAGALQIVGLLDESAEQATVRARTSNLAGRLSESKFPMKKSGAGWKLVVPDDMIEGMRRRAVRSGGEPPVRK